MGYYPQFPEVISHLRADCPRVTELSAGLTCREPKRAWLNQTPIAVPSSRINWSYNYFGRILFFIGNCWFALGFTCNIKLIKHIVDVPS
jgi:hypothetical protein